MNRNSAFIRFYTENLIRFQQLDLRQIRLLKGGQTIVDFHAVDICRLYVTTTKAMNFKDDIPFFPIESFRDHFVLLFALT